MARAEGENTMTVILVLIWLVGVVVTAMQCYSNIETEEDESHGEIVISFLWTLALCIFWPLWRTHSAHEWIKSTSWALSENLAIAIAFVFFLILRN